MITIQNQNFGVEIELTGISRQAAAQVIADYYGTIGTRFMGTVYKTYEAVDNKGRRWKCMRDASITPQRRVNGHVVDANDEYKCEVVTPILQYEDIPDLQAIVRALVKKGAMANASCGIHVHVDGANHTPESLSRLLNFAAGRQDLFYESLQIGERADQWCHKISPELFKAMKKQGRSSRAAAEEIWYSSVNDGYSGGISHVHYNQTRYHGINLHAFFTKGTVEFRLFNGTTHAGRIKAYIQFCLAMSAWSIVNGLLVDLFVLGGLQLLVGIFLVAVAQVHNLVSDFGVKVNTRNGTHAAVGFLEFVIRHAQGGQQLLIGLVHALAGGFALGLCLGQLQLVLVQLLGDIVVLLRHIGHELLVGLRLGAVLPCLGISAQRCGAALYLAGGGINMPSSAE